jgi:hypothetical protein
VQVPGPLQFKEIPRKSDKLRMTTPLIALLLFVNSANAADVVPGQVESIATTKNIQATLKSVDAGAPSCAGSYAQSKCPGVQPKGLRESYLQPEKDFYDRLFSRLNSLNLTAALDKNVTKPVVSSVDAGKGADEAIIADVTPRLKSVADARKAAEAMEKEVKDRIAELHKKDPKVASEAVACGAQNMASESKIMEFCGRLDSKKDAISCVLKAGPFDLTCNSNTRAQYGTYVDVQIKQLAADLGVLTSYLKQKETSLAADKTSAAPAAERAPASAAAPAAMPDWMRHQKSAF